MLVKIIDILLTKLKLSPLHVIVLGFIHTSITKIENDNVKKQV